MKVCPFKYDKLLLTTSTVFDYLATQYLQQEQEQSKKTKKEASQSGGINEEREFEDPFRLGNLEKQGANNNNKRRRECCA